MSLKFKEYNLKLIEIQNENFHSLVELLEIITNLDFKFILFLDDISFQKEDNNFKTLKAVLDGRLVEHSNNFIIYATSNRRHLIKETHFENNEIHIMEAISEKISLADRFGLSFGFYKPDKESYLRIIKHYLNKFNLDKFFSEKEALQFAMQKGGFSGRTAYQYAVFLYGKLI
jgi:predicted AAA+ superfamily ATPase